MKIHITLDQPDRAGYLNTRELDLTKICRKFECDELYAPEVFNNLSYEETQTFLNIMTSWLAPNTRLVVGGTDIYLLAKSVINRSMRLEIINKVLFEKKERLNSVHSLSLIKDYMIESGYKIQNIAFDYSIGAFTIEALR